MMNQSPQMKKPVMPSGRTPSNPGVSQQMGKMGLGPSPQMMRPPMNPSMGQQMGQMGGMNPQMRPLNTGPQTTGMSGMPSGQQPGLFQQQYPQGSGLGPSFTPDDPRDPRRFRGMQ